MKHDQFWEQFRVHQLEGQGYVALQCLAVHSENPVYLTAFPDGNVRAFAEWKREWEALEVIPSGQDQVLLKTAHGYYIGSSTEGHLTGLWDQADCYARWTIKTLGGWCQICMESVGADICGREERMAGAAACGHTYCRACTREHLFSRIQGRQYPLICATPECGATFDQGTVWRLLAEDPATLEILSQLEVIHATVQEALYCPFNDCSKLLIRDDQAVHQSACPYCHRAFCPTCRTEGWHEGYTCEQNQERSRNQEVFNLADQLHWRQCPHCAEMVERKDGCNHIKCHCGCGFCYACGTKYLTDVREPGFPHGRPGCQCGIWGHGH